MSTFTHAGVSTLNGSCKVRFANDALRVKVLAKNGHKDIDIVQLKHPMTKAEAVEYMLSIDFDNGNATVRAALEAAQEKRSDKPTVAAAPKAVKAKAPAKKSTPSMDAIKAKAAAKARAVVVAEAEDAPF
jgi:hypothetical protein